MFGADTEGLERYGLGADLDLLDELTGGEIVASACTQRVAALPRRAEIDKHTVARFSAALAKHGGAQLRDDQAIALREYYETGGLFGPMRVGSGKTLVTLLAKTLLGSERAVLLIPASLRDKTRREFLEYASAWRVQLPHLVSYEELGRPDREHELFKVRPDVLIADEAHRLRNLRAACTRRVARYWATARPRFAALSGTLISEHLMDYWHLLLWCLGDRAPVPLTHAEAQRWAAAVDSDPGEARRIGLGVLAQLGDFHAWVRGTRGVVPTPGADCPASIEISMWDPPLPPELQDLIEQVEQTRMRPDGELLEDLEVSDTLMQLALGFWYRWDPQPPDWWLEPRRVWAKFVRDVLDQHWDGFDSPSQVVHALDRARASPDEPPTAALPPGVANYGRGLLAAWRAVRDEFEPNTVPVWVDDAPLRAAAARAEAGTLVWVKFRAAGERLEQLGIPYYPGGTDPQTARPGRPIALSIAAHSTGRNMQAWHRALVMTPPANVRGWEQMIGREHRMGQTRDTVKIQVYTATDYHRDVMRRVRASARATSSASGFDQKLTIATWV